MFSISLSFISGVMLGFEFVSDNDLLDDSYKENHFVMDLLIVRVLVSWGIQE